MGAGEELMMDLTRLMKDGASSTPLSCGAKDPADEWCDKALSRSTNEQDRFQWLRLYIEIS